MPQFGQSRYRWTSQFFREDLRLIPSLKPKVHEKFSQYTSLTGENLRLAFLSYTEPLVKLENIPGELGHTPPVGDEIWLDKTFIGELEDALPKNRVPRDQAYAPSELEEKALLLLEVTVVHEMVHYFRRKFISGVQAKYSFARGRDEEETVAQQFEKDAYGMYYMVENLSIARYFPRTAAKASSK
jgi:hypothetical protein